LTQGVADYLKTQPGPGTSTVLYDWFGGLDRTMYTLYLAISGGQDWQVFADPLLAADWLTFTIFVAYITFMLFAVLNIVTAIFVENTMQVAQRNADWIIKQQMSNEKFFYNEMQDLFTAADHDKSGTLSLKELEKHLSDQHVRARLNVFGLEVSEAWGFFQLLDIDDRGFVDVSQFALGCLRLRGAAKGIDAATLMYENKKMMAVISDHLNRLTVRIEKITGAREGSMIT